MSKQRSVREQPRRVLDDASRQRRARKAIESLEADNHHDDPHADLVMSKKALTLFQDENEGVKKVKKKTRNSEYYKMRFRKNFSQLLEEDATQKATAPNYLSAQAPPSVRPQRRFCAVCGFPSCYTCVVCGARYCCLACKETHNDTRCMKYTM